MGVKFLKVRNIELFALFCNVCDVYEPEPTMFWSAEARLTYACRKHIPFKSSVISFRFGIDTLIVRNGKSMILESSESICAEKYSKTQTDGLCRLCCLPGRSVDLNGGDNLG
jgi:hypothetical protein